MKNLLILLIGCMVAWLGSCTFGDMKIDVPKDGIVGTWTLEAVLANDTWGSPLTWRAETGKEIRFSADSLYFEKLDGSFRVMGTYSLHKKGYVEIGPVAPQTWPSYQLELTIDSLHRLTLRKQQFEGRVADRYTRESY